MGEYDQIGNQIAKVGVRAALRIDGQGKREISLMFLGGTVVMVMVAAVMLFAGYSTATRKIDALVRARAEASARLFGTELDRHIEALDAVAERLEGTENSARALIEELLICGNFVPEAELCVIMGDERRLTAGGAVSGDGPDLGEFIDAGKGHKIGGVSGSGVITVARELDGPGAAKGAVLMVRFRPKLAAGFSDGEFVFARKGDRIIFANLPGADQDMCRSIAEEASKRSVIEVDGEKYFHYEKDISGLSVLVYIPSEVSEGVYAGVVMLLLVALVAVGFCAVLAISMHRTAEHAGSIMGRLKLPTTRNVDAMLEAMGDELEERRKQVETYQTQFSRLLPMSIGEMFRKICRTEGEISLQISRRCLELVGIGTGSPFFVFGVLLFENSEEFLGENRAISIISPYFVLNNVLSDLIFEKKAGSVVLMGKYHYVIFECGSGDTPESVGNILQYLETFFKTNFDIGIATTSLVFGNGAGELKDAIGKVSIEAMHLDFWHREPDDGGELPFVGKGEAKEDVSLYFKYVRNLINRMDGGDYQGAFEIFEKILSSSVPSGVQSINVAKCYAYGVLGLLIAAISEQIEQGGIGEETWKSFENIFNITNLDDFHNEVKSIFLKLVECRDTEDISTKNRRRISEIKDYITEHYAESDLSVSGIADRFGISNSYLSHAFKNGAGCNILEYIQMVRVGKAKELLKDYSVGDTAAKVGFSVVQTFSRVFKQFEGISPKEYKSYILSGHGTDDSDLDKPHGI